MRSSSGAERLTVNQDVACSIQAFAAIKQAEVTALQSECGTSYSASAEAEGIS